MRGQRLKIRAPVLVFLTVGRYLESYGRSGRIGLRLTISGGSEASLMRAIPAGEYSCQRILSVGNNSIIQVE